MDQTVKSHFEAIEGLYNFITGFEWAYKWGGGGAYIWGHISGIKKMFHKDEMKRT